MNSRHTNEAPLRGVRVLVGRARQQAGALSAELRKHGATVIEIPFIEIRKPRSFKPLDSSLRNLHTYDWLILTSVNGVEAMWERMSRLGLSFDGNGGAPTVGKQKYSAACITERNRLRVAAIGPATKKAIEQRGTRVDVVPKEFTIPGLVSAIISAAARQR